MVDKLCKVGFQQSLIDECFIVYVDDGLFFGSDDNTLSLIIKKLQGSCLNIEDQGHPADYVGVNNKETYDGTHEFTQGALIDAIIDDVHLGNPHIKPVLVKVTLQLHAFRDSARPDIMYAIHQVAKSSTDPRQEYGETMLHIVKYLKATHHFGLCFKPDPSKGFQCYCDADFAGN